MEFRRVLFRSNDTATTEIYTVLHTLSLHDALPVWLLRQYNPDLDFDRIQAGAVVRFPRLKAIAADAAVAAAPQVLADNLR